MSTVRACGSISSDSVAHSQEYKLDSQASNSECHTMESAMDDAGHSGTQPACRSQGAYSRH